MNGQNQPLVPLICINKTDPIPNKKGGGEGSNTLGQHQARCYNYHDSVRCTQGGLPWLHYC